MFMFINKNHYNNTYGVYDTEDYSLEYIDLPALTAVIKSGVRIEGVMRGRNGFKFRINPEPLVTNENGVFFVHILDKGHVCRLGFEKSPSQIRVNMQALSDEARKYRDDIYKAVQKFLNTAYSDTPIKMLNPIGF